MSKEKTTSSGLGLATVLFLIFLTLKLAEVGQVKDWSWWWVTSPLWISVLFAIGVLIIVGLFYLFAYLYKRHKYPAGHYKRHTNSFERAMENRTPKKSQFQQRLEAIEKKRNESK